MEADETVPLTFEQQQDGQDGAGIMAGLPDGFTPQVRQAGAASVIDITGMLSDLEASRSGRR